MPLTFFLGFWTETTFHGDCFQLAPLKLQWMVIGVKRSRHISLPNQRQGSCDLLARVFSRYSPAVIGLFRLLVVIRLTSTI